MNYEAFLASKAPRVEPAGFEPRADLIPPDLFPFQRAIVEWSTRQGRAAVFAECGLGKTAIQLSWAAQVHAHTSQPVLILAPLAVASQTVHEGERFGVDVRYVRSAAELAMVPTPVAITNYERLDRFDLSAFGGVVTDESSILKSFMGATKQALIERCAAIPYRLACTATPAPNDHMELGNHAEFLGVLTSHEMLARWFINDTSTFGTYRLKGHAVESFWDWVSSWAVCCGVPSDIGPFSDDGYVLPELRTHLHVLDADVTTDRGEHLFRIPDLSATSIHRERRMTLHERAARVGELVAAEPGEPWIVWCETDYEADALRAAIPDAIEVRGSHPLERKEGSLDAFATGDARVLISKPSVCGWGLNWQHCARVAFVSATYSYESFYQALRRCWRFGQGRPVDVHVVMASTERGVWDVLARKRDDHERMKVEMFAAARRAQARSSARRAYEPGHEGRLPAWLTVA